MSEQPFLRTRGLTVSTGMAVPDLSVDGRLNLICTGRETSATTTMLTLAGRMKPKHGTVVVRDADGKDLSSPRQIAKQVAMAGVPDIDGLDRNVAVQTYIREVVAWASPWYRHTPRDINDIEQWVHIQQLCGLDFDTRATVGSLSPANRFIIRVILALLARPNAAAVIIDDIDQVRSLEIQSELISHLRTLSETTPVLVASTNDDVEHRFDTVTYLSRKQAQ